VKESDAVAEAQDAGKKIKTTHGFASHSPGTLSQDAYVASRKATAGAGKGNVPPKVST
jgi:hypothetical protein